MLSILCINAFIYGAKYREFQDGVRRLMSILCCRVYHQGSIQDQGFDLTYFATQGRPTTGANSCSAAVVCIHGRPSLTHDTCVIGANPVSFIASHCHDVNVLLSNII